MPVTRHLPAALILLSIAGLASENFSHFPVGTMCLLGLYWAWRDYAGVVRSREARLLLGVFACVWVPMLLALPDAVNPARAMKTTFLYVHFLPAGLYVIYMLRDHVVRRIVWIGLALIIAFWCIDGMIQLVAGKDLFGYPYDGSVLKGVFYPKQRFGLILAVFAPLYLSVVRRLAARSWWAWLLLLPLLVGIVFSLKRTAWVMLLAALGAYLACFVRPRRTDLRLAIGASGVATAALVLAIVFVPNLRTQVTGTFNLFSTDFERVDIATSRRLSLWHTGLGMVRAHWLNGIGPRGFRTVYREFAGPDDFWIKLGTSGQTHPHLMVLEVLIETGVIGLIAYILLLIILTREMWRQRLDDPRAATYLMIALVAWFPLNAHLAFYGSYWSTLVWIVIALGCAGSDNERGVRSQQHPTAQL
jgi:O-antigen ligase